LKQVAYQRILQLTYVDELLHASKTLFIKYFEPFITAFVASLHAINSAGSTAVQAANWDFSKAFEGWDAIFDKLLRGFEEKAASVRGSQLL
jgi:signal recognition particle receptor subunit alpha